MAGIALIVKNADYSGFGLGTVTPNTESSLVTDGLVGNYDAFGLTSNLGNTVTLADDVSVDTISVNGHAGGNCIVFSTSNESFCYDNASKIRLGSLVNGRSAWTLELVCEVFNWNNTKDIVFYADYSSARNGKVQFHLGPINNGGGGLSLRYKNSWVFGAWDKDIKQTFDYSSPHVIHMTLSVADGKTIGKLYVDGVLEGTAQISLALDIVALSSDILHTSGLTGKFYALRGYNRVLSDLEIAQNAEYDKIRYNL